jgi:glyoxylate carboligase
MKLSDCEILHIHARNCPGAVVIGARAVTEAEAAELLAEFAEVSGLPAAYFSRAGWQTLAVAPQAPAEAPAAKPAAKKAKV